MEEWAPFVSQLREQVEFPSFSPDELTNVAALAKEVEVLIDARMATCILQSEIIAKELIRLKDETPRDFRENRFVSSSIEALKRVIEITDGQSDLFMSTIKRACMFDKELYKTQSRQMIAWLELKQRRRRRKSNVAFAHWLYLMDSIFSDAPKKPNAVRQNLKRDRRDSHFIDFAYAVACRHLPRAARSETYNAMAKTWEEIRPHRAKFNIRYDNPDAAIGILISAFFHHYECCALKTYLTSEGLHFINSAFKTKNNPRRSKAQNTKTAKRWH